MNLFNRFTKKDRDAMKHPKFQPVIGFEEASSLKFKALDDDIRLKLRKYIKYYKNEERKGKGKGGTGWERVPW